MSWLGKLEKARAEMAARDANPWRLPLERLQGKIGDDGIERVTTQALFDILEIPQRARGAGACRRLAKLMAELGWSAVRVRGDDARRVPGAGPRLLQGCPARAPAALADRDRADTSLFWFL
jgi:hypothetical protein